MQLPEELQLGIEKLFENVSSLLLRKSREELSKTYKEGGISPFSDEASLLAYLGARMPATYAAVYKTLQNVHLEGHILDLGAGLGAASWAMLDLFPNLEKITLIEQNQNAIRLGEKLLSSSKTHWILQNLSAPIPKANAAVLSYVMNELKSPEQVIKNCWGAVDTLVIIEPGTPKAFGLMKKIREQLIGAKAHIIAPCPHTHACLNDWCHFSARVERTKIHRLLKEGSLGHEDEKFCYLIASKSGGASCSNRVIRHPLKQSGYVSLNLCTKQGTLEEKTISRKNKELYRKARDAEWGSSF